MIYEYSCVPCDSTFDVVKTVDHMKDAEYCELCNAEAVRKFVPNRVHLSKTAVEFAEYNPGLGQVVDSRYHRSELCKEKGLTEVGNENPDSLEKDLKKARIKKANDAYDKD
mgnify:CR=1 FL=1